MPFSIVRNDLTRMSVDAIVNSAAPHLLGGGGADGAIHRAAGPELKKACRALGGCKTGQVKATPGFHLPCRYVFHTVGPVWMGGRMGEEEKLRSCYRNALELAMEMQLESIAFPLISSGLFRFPRAIALQVATEEISQFVLKNDMQVYLVVYDRESFRISTKLMEDIHQYIDDRYIEEKQWDSFFADREAPLCAAPRETFSMAPQCCMPEPVETDYSDGFAADACPVSADWDVCPEEKAWTDQTFRMEEPGASTRPYPNIDLKETTHEDRLRSILLQQDEGFSQRLLRLIDQSGMTDPECYRRANIDRRLFSKIRNNGQYKPTKQTALAFAVALRLNVAQTDDLLRSAGLALSHSSRFDLVVEYFIKQGIFDVMRINEALYAFDLPLLGC